MRDQSMTKIIASENDVFVFEYVHYAGSYICKKGNQVKFFYFEGDLNHLYHFFIDSKEYRAYLKLSDLYAKRASRCRRTDSIYAINRQKPSKRYRKYKRTKFRITSSYPLYSYQNAALERIRAKTLCAASLAKENLKNYCILRTSLQDRYQEQYRFSCDMPDNETVIRFMLDRMNGVSVSFKDLIDADIVFNSYQRIYI